MKILISPKVDSKGQRRVQCSIPGFKNLIPKYFTYKSSGLTSNIIRGKSIPKKIFSKRRNRGGVSKEDLLHICRKNKLKRYSRKNKNDIVEMLKTLNLMPS